MIQRYTLNVIFSDQDINEGEEIYIKKENYGPGEGQHDIEGDFLIPLDTNF